MTQAERHLPCEPVSPLSHICHTVKNMDIVTKKTRVGIIGYGKIGQFLVKEISSRGDKLGLELAFVWNRTPEALSAIPLDLRLARLDEFVQKRADLIVEVAHPDITRNHGHDFLARADYMVGSPSVLADRELGAKLLKGSKLSGHGVFVPSGALWGGADIRRMSDRGNLAGLVVEMSFHPSSLKVNSPLKEANEAVTNEATILYEGSVRELCPLAPNNVNTMACAAIAGHSLGFDGVRAKLISDPTIKNCHVIKILVTGPATDGQNFEVTTNRVSPAAKGAVSSSATLVSFLASVMSAKHQGPGFHLC